jgi:hypothetical protein
MAVDVVTGGIAGLLLAFAGAWIRPLLSRRR